MTNPPSYEEWKLDLLTYDEYWFGETILDDVDETLTALYATQLMQEAGSLWEQVPSEDLGETLWFFLGQILTINWELIPNRQTSINCITAMQTLFRDLYDPHCAPVLGHLDEQPTTPLNLSCYMWWDMLPIYSSDPAQHQELSTASLETMVYCLRLKNIACKESALHGLSHFHTDAPTRVSEIIRDSARFIPKKLESYAKSAANGCVL